VNGAQPGHEFPDFGYAICPRQYCVALATLALFGLRLDLASTAFAYSIAIAPVVINKLAAVEHHPERDEQGE
jgi:hypothetical protein